MYRHILVGTDGSTTASRAVESAARLAHAHHARLTIAHAFRARLTYTDPGPVPDDLAWLRSPGATADAIVANAAGLAQAVACGSLEVQVRPEVGTPRSVLRALMQELDPDAVVVGNADARRSFTGRGLGSNLVGRTRADVIVVDTSDSSASTRGSRSAA
jgi:nucleotide-binding universal stress UspA family protein